MEKGERERGRENEERVNIYYHQPLQPLLHILSEFNTTEACVVHITRKKQPCFLACYLFFAKLSPGDLISLWLLDRNCAVPGLPKILERQFQAILTAN